MSSEAFQLRPQRARTKYDSTVYASTNAIMRGVSCNGWDHYEPTFRGDTQLKARHLEIRHGLLVLLFLVAALFVAPCSAQAVKSLKSYTSLQTVARISDDKDIQHRLQTLLGPDYQPFLANFDVWGEPTKLADGGLLVEGWLRDLYLYEASAFAIFPDGRIYAARADASDKSGSGEGTIRYYSNDPAYKAAVHPATMSVQDQITREKR